MPLILITMSIIYVSDFRNLSWQEVNISIDMNNRFRFMLSTMLRVAVQHWWNVSPICKQLEGIIKWDKHELNFQELSTH
jgi:hypothetical protein